MTLLFIFLFLYNFLQIFVFLTIWCYFLLVIFRLTVFLIMKRYPQYGQNVAVCASLLLSCSILFELLHQYSGVDFLKHSDSCPWWNYFLYTSCNRGNVNWFGAIWQLNPFYVMAHLIENVIVTASHLCGRLVAGYVGGIFHDQSWLLGFISLLFTFVVIIVSICLRIFLVPYQTVCSHDVKIADR